MTASSPCQRFFFAAFLVLAIVHLRPSCCFARIETGKVFNPQFQPWKCCTCGYCSISNAAFRCGRYKIYKEGASIYDTFRAVSTDLDSFGCSSFLCCSADFRELAGISLSAFAVFGMKLCQLVSSMRILAQSRIGAAADEMWKLLQCLI